MKNCFSVHQGEPPVCLMRVPGVLPLLSCLRVPSVHVMCVGLVVLGPTCASMQQQAGKQARAAVSLSSNHS